MVEVNATGRTQIQQVTNRAHHKIWNKRARLSLLYGRSECESCHLEKTWNFSSKLMKRREPGRIVNEDTVFSTVVYGGADGPVDSCLPI